MGRIWTARHATLMGPSPLGVSLLSLMENTALPRAQAYVVCSLGSATFPRSTVRRVKGAVVPRRVVPRRNKNGRENVCQGVGGQAATLRAATCYG